MRNISRIKSIEIIGNEDVYNMEVEAHHNYSVNGGLIVHNCDALRGFCIMRQLPTEEKDDKNKKPHWALSEDKPPAQNYVSSDDVTNSYLGGY